MTKPNETINKTRRKVIRGTTSASTMSKTIIPVRLTQYGNDKLVARSQAKRLLIGVERFKTVIFDFDGVDTIGQAFADEIFRVYKLQHSEMELTYLNANEQVTQMITRALANQ